MSPDSPHAADRTHLLRFAPAVLLGLLGIYQALVTNNFNDFFIYRAGAQIGIRGESPYDIARFRELASAQFPDPDPQPKPDSFLLNCGYFLPPMAILVLAPFAVLSWTAAKVAGAQSSVWPRPGSRCFRTYCV